jgi:hypothetical protein
LEIHFAKSSSSLSLLSLGGEEDASGNTYIGGNKYDASRFAMDNLAMARWLNASAAPIDSTRRHPL